MAHPLMLTHIFLLTNPFMLTHPFSFTPFPGVVTSEESHYKNKTILLYKPTIAYNF